MYVDINGRMLVNMDEVLTMEIDRQTGTNLVFVIANPARRQELECSYRTPEKAKEAYQTIIAGLAAKDALISI